MQPATLEIFATAGVLEAFLASSVHLDCARMFDPNLEVVGEMRFAGTGCPWEFQCSLPQWRTEEILAERLAELGGRIERGVAATSLEPADDGVLVSLERGDGTTEMVAAEWVIGAGGAHSITRASMAESLVGETYRGTCLVGDMRLHCELPRDGSVLIATEKGYVGGAPLPGDRWLTFIGDLEEEEVDRVAKDTSTSAVADLIRRRVAGAIRVDDVAWASPFRMHRRMVPKLAMGRRFLLGDAGHLSSPFGGEGLNSGLQDAHNLAWKLALTIRGRARRELLESFASERLSADRHVLEVSDRLHALVHEAVESARTGVTHPPPAPSETAAIARSRAMLDVSYEGSPIVGEHVGPEVGVPPAPGPGDRYPDRAALGGTRHHFLLFGGTDEAALAHLEQRWHDLLDVERATGDPRRAGLDTDGAVLVRPDGHIGFRAAPANTAGLAAVDSHLASYLIPR